MESTIFVPLHILRHIEHQLQNNKMHVGGDIVKGPLSRGINPNDTEWRLTVLLALDEHVYEDSPWGGMEDGKITGYFKSWTGYDKSIPTEYILLITNVVTIDEFDLNKKKSEQLIYGGWFKHAIGILITKLGSNYEVCIQNSGSGSMYGGYSKSPSHTLECGGILIFKNVPTSHITEFVARAKWLNGDNGELTEDQSVLSMLFYRFVLAPLYITHFTNYEYLSEPWKDPIEDRGGGTMRCEVIEMPSQSSGDCSLRAILFTPLASRRFRGDDRSVPRWFWPWYAKNVSRAVMTLVQDDRLKLTQAEFVAMHSRLIGIQALLDEKLEKLDAKEARKIIAETRDACTSSCAKWYRKLETESNPFALSHRKISKGPDARHDIHAPYLQKDNTIIVSKVPVKRRDIVASVRDILRASTWDALDRIVSSVARQIKDDYPNYSRCELVALTTKMYSLLLVSSSDVYSMMRVAVTLTKSMVVPHPCEYMMLLALCYITLRHAIKQNYTEYNDLIATFTPIADIELKWFDVPVYNHMHSRMLRFVVGQLRILKVMGNAEQSCSAASLAVHKSMTSVEVDKDKTETIEKYTGKRNNVWKQEYVFRRMFDAIKECELAPPPKEHPGRQRIIANVLVYLSSIFKYGGRPEMYPIILATYGDIATKYRTPSARYVSDIEGTKCDMLNPGKRSIDQLLTGLESPTPMDHPTSFVIRHGIQNPNNIVPNGLSTDCKTYSHDDLATPVCDHLPSADVMVTEVNKWFTLLLDKSHPFVLSLGKDKWNMHVISLLYLVGQYDIEIPKEISQKLDQICNAPLCCQVVKQLIALFTSIPASQTKTSTALWTIVLNANIPSRQSYDDIPGSTHGSFYGKQNTTSGTHYFHLLLDNNRYIDDELHSFDPTKHVDTMFIVPSQTDTLDGFCLYQFVLSLMCYTLVDRQLSTLQSFVPTSVMTAANEADLKSTFIGNFMKSSGGKIGEKKDWKYMCFSNENSDVVSYTTETPAKDSKKAVYSAVFGFEQHFSARIEARLGTLFSVHDRTFWSTKPRNHLFHISEDEGDNTTMRLVILEPYPPHPYFQTEFSWSPGVKADTFFGVPESASLLKPNNYCLIYVKSSDGRRTVTQAPHPSGGVGCRLDAKMLSAGGKDPWSFVPIEDIFEKGANTVVDNLCARLLLFMYADHIVVWRKVHGLSTDYKIELLAHRTTLFVANDIVRTQGGIILDTSVSKDKHIRFWTGRMPSVFLAKDNTVLSLFIFDVQRIEPGAIPSSNLTQVFGDDGEVLTRIPVKPCDAINAAGKSRIVGAHNIALKPDTFELLLPTGCVELLSFSQVANFFGRTDIVAEIASLLNLLKSVSTHLPQSNVTSTDLPMTNFPRIKYPGVLGGAITYGCTFNRYAVDAVGLSGYNFKNVAGFLTTNMKKNMNTTTTTRCINISSGLPEPIPNKLAISKLAMRSIDLRRMTNIVDDELIAANAHTPWYKRLMNAKKGTPWYKRLLDVNKKTPESWYLRAFEFVTGRIPRTEQRDLADKIHASYVTKSDSMIYNMIMGGGKTAVVTPLIVMMSVLGESEGERESIVLITPDRLIMQTLQLMIPLILYIGLPVEIITSIESASKELGKKGTTTTPKLFLMSDRMAKECVIFKEIVGARTELRYLIDEADTIMNPLTSELNMPLDMISLDEMMNPSDAKEIYNELLMEMTHKLAKRERASYPLENREFLNLDVPPPFDFVIKAHPTSVLMTGNASKFSKSMHTYRPYGIGELPPSLKPTSHTTHGGGPTIKWRGTQLYAQMTSILEFIPSQTHCLHYGHLNEPPDIRRILNMFTEYGRNQLSQILDGDDAKMIELLGVAPNKDNRYSQLESKVNKFHLSDILAVPYRYANVPSVGSEFSDPVLTIGFTIASLLRTGLSDIRLHFMAEMITRNIAEYSECKLFDGYMQADNAWVWIKENLKRLENDFYLISVYLQVMIPRTLRVFRYTRSACGLDLVMSGTHPLRNGFTGTPEDITLIDDGIKTLKVAPVHGRSPDEVAAMAKLICKNSSTNILDLICAAAYNAIIDVGAVFLGKSPGDILCTMITTRKDVDQLAYWDQYDLPCIVDISGSVTPWDLRQKKGQVVYYDHAHTTGTDAVLLDKVNACITIRNGTTYRDFIQGLFRLRKIVKESKTKCTVIVPSTITISTPDGLQNWLDSNTATQKASQDPLRSVHNTMAFMRSQSKVDTDDKSSFRLVRSAYTDYLANVPGVGSGYLASAIKKLAHEQKSNGIAEALAKLLHQIQAHPQTNSITTSTVTRVVEATDVKMEEAQDTRRNINVNQVAVMGPQTILNEPLPFRLIYDVSPVNIQYFEKEANTYVSTMFRFMYAMHYNIGHFRFRAFIVKVSFSPSVTREIRVFKLTFTDGILLIDHMKKVNKSQLSNLSKLEISLGGILWYTVTHSK